MTRAETKPDLVLIHGWGLGNLAWSAVLPALMQRFSVHLLDLPGYRSPAARVDKQSTDIALQNPHEQTILEPLVCRTPFDAASSDTLIQSPSFIETAAAFAEAIPDGAFVCGWSLGAMLSLQVAALAPQRIKGLILVGATPSFTQRTDWSHAQPPALLDTFCDAIANDAAGTLQRFVALLNQGDTQARSISRALNKALQGSFLPATATLLDGLGWLRDVDVRESVASIDVPALLIHGENDPLMPLAAAEWLHATLPNATLNVAHGAAHAPFLNDPEGFAKQIGDYFHAPARD